MIYAIIGRLFRNSNNLGLNKKIHLDLNNIKILLVKNNNIIAHLYPEGTRITYDKLNKSKEYSKKIIIKNIIIYYFLK